MNSPSQKLWPAVAAAVVALAMFQVASAQPDEGRRGGGPGGRGFGGGFGISPLRLATIDEVEAELKLSDEQKEKIEEINDEQRDEFRKLLQAGGRREEMQKLNQDYTAKLNEVLDEEQQKRLKGIWVQILGANVVVIDAEIAKELNVTDEQKTKLAEVSDANMQAMGEAFREMRDQDLSGDERRAKFEELRAEANKKLVAELTSAQQEQLEALKGEKVEIDMSQLRGPGRGGFGGRGDRDRNRDRDRESDQERRERSREESESEDPAGNN